MKRDMDLIRHILFEIEKSSEPRYSSSISYGEYTNTEIAYHFELLLNADFAVGSSAMDETGMPFDSSIQYLTWEGHEFLGLCKKDTIWEKAKSKVWDTTGSISIELLKTCLLNTCREMIGS